MIMRARDVVGKRVVRVLQERVWNTHLGMWVGNVTGFVLDNGTVVSLNVVEDDYGYQIEASVVRVGKGGE